jgi:hypothetical protein
MAQDYLQKRVSGIKDSGKRKSAYYKLQREQAEEGGDQDTTDKIYKKLGKKSHNVDSDRGNKAILGAAPFLPEAVESLGARGAASAAGYAGRAIGGAARKALGSGERAASGLAKRGEGAVEGAYQRLRTPTPVKRALGSSKPALGAKSQSRSLSPAEKHNAKAGSNNSPNSMQGNQRKALGTSGQWHYEKELGKQAGRKLPKEPKTFNRNGTKKAEGRQKSDRNPVSKRKSTAKSKHMDEWSQ